MQKLTCLIAQMDAPECLDLHLLPSLYTMDLTRALKLQTSDRATSFLTQELVLCQAGINSTMLSRTLNSTLLFQLQQSHITVEQGIASTTITRACRYTTGTSKQVPMMTRTLTRQAFRDTQAHDSSERQTLFSTLESSFSPPCPDGLALSPPPEAADRITLERRARRSHFPEGSGT